MTIDRIAQWRFAATGGVGVGSRRTAPAASLAPELRQRSAAQCRSPSP